MIGLCAGPVRTSTNETISCPKYCHGYKSHIMGKCVCLCIYLEGASDWLVTSCDFCIKHWIRVRWFLLTNEECVHCGMERYMTLPPNLSLHVRTALGRGVFTWRRWLYLHSRGTKVSLVFVWLSLVHNGLVCSCVLVLLCTSRCWQSWWSLLEATTSVVVNTAGLSCSHPVQTTCLKWPPV